MICIALLSACAGCAESGEPEAAALETLAATAEPQASPQGPFQMTAEDAFRIASGGVVVTGQIASGVVRTGDRVCLSNGQVVEVLGIEVFKRLLDAAQAGDRVGLLLSDISVNDVSSGDQLRGPCAAASQ